MSPTKATKKPAPAASSPKTADKKSPPKRAIAGSPEAASDTHEVAVTTPASSPDADSTTAEVRGVAAAGDHSAERQVEPADLSGERQSAPPTELSLDRTGLDRTGLDRTGLDKAGLDKAGLDKDGRRERAPSAVQTLALELIASGDAAAVQRHAAALEDERETVANHAARLVQELAELKPELLVPLIDRFGRLLVSKNRRVVASCAGALAPLSRIAPAKVAKQLPVLTQHWELTTEEGKDGLVRTFAGLCTASVAYQKRLEPALARALGEADPKLLVRWTEIVLPALKGEPHARARAVVEERLPIIPRPVAQKIADFLGIKLRPLPR